MAQPNTESQKAKKLTSKWQKYYFQDKILYQTIKKQKNKEKQGIQETQLQHKGEDEPLPKMMESQKPQERRGHQERFMSKLSRPIESTMYLEKQEKVFRNNLQLFGKHQ